MIAKLPLAPQRTLALCAALALGGGFAQAQSSGAEPNQICLRSEAAYVARVTFEVSRPQGNNWRTTPSTILAGQNHCERFANGLNLRMIVEKNEVVGWGMICTQQFSPARTANITLRGTVFDANCSGG